MASPEALAKERRAFAERSGWITAVDRSESPRCRRPQAALFLLVVPRGGPTVYRQTRPCASQAEKSQVQNSRLLPR
jgi:hypothetical protein